MLASDLELFYARERYAALHKDRYSIFDADAPATVRLRLRLPSAASVVRERERALVAVLHARPADATSATAAQPEVARVTLAAAHTAAFHAFDHAFEATCSSDARVSLHVAESFDGVLRNTTVATCDVSVPNIVAAHGERLEVALRPAEGAIDAGYAFAGGKVEFGLEWMNDAGVQLVLEVRVKVQKDCGWPFSTARPFFVMYRWEPADASWTPLYRSEVLTKQSDRNDANGSMIFQMAEMFLGERHADVDDRALRFELFHYKTTDSPKLVGYFSTTLRSLRQAAVGDPLKLELNTFISGELIGQLSVNTSKVTLKRHFFSLQFDLGGNVPGPTVYFAVNVLEEKKPPARSRLRPHYVVSRYSDRGKWEHIYRSEAPSRVFGKRNYSKYKVAKFSEDKLLKGSVHRTISLMFYYDTGRDEDEPTEIGHFITTPFILLEARAGMSFVLAPPEGRGESPGYIVVQQGARNEAATHLEATCILGRPPPKNAILPLAHSDSS